MQSNLPCVLHRKVPGKLHHVEEVLKAIGTLAVEFDVKPRGEVDFYAKVCDGDEIFSCLPHRHVVFYAPTTECKPPRMAQSTNDHIYQT